MIVTDVATLVGYTVVSRPFLDLSNPKYLNSSHGQRLEVTLLYILLVLMLMTDDNVASDDGICLSIVG